LDVMALLDRLENLVASSARIPLTGKIVTDEETIYGIIDDIRASLPEELKQAKLVVKERERLVDDARRDAEDMVKDAQSKIGELAREQVVVQEASRQAQEIIDKARAVAQEITDGAKGYADEVMGDLLATLERVAQSTKLGQEELRKSRMVQEAVPDQTKSE
jgi:cell division septum initiation protein DivIVA